MFTCWAGCHAPSYVLVNDWSARDIQRWESVPLGPFNSKNWVSVLGSPRGWLFLLGSMLLKARLQRACYDQPQATMRTAWLCPGGPHSLASGPCI
jgi:hypothetical protein